MSGIRSLMSAGLPGRTASAIGKAVRTGVTSTVTTQASATKLNPNEFATLTTASGQTGYVLTASQVGDEYLLFNTTATTALIYPPSGGKINLGSADAAFSLAQNKAALISQYDATAGAPLYAAILTA